MALRAALADGTIDMVGTDHAPHLAADKAKPFAQAAFGMMGLEAAVPVVTHTMVRSGMLSWSDVARVMSFAPAAMAGLAGQGRPLAVGEPAHLVAIDAEAAHVVDGASSVSKSRNNPWDQASLTGMVKATVWGGTVTCYDGRVGRDCLEASGAPG
ncbi:glycerophosphodiester phosphodiesterase [Platysternon megacephalum]|uniref:Glycerophosphodiester phosphodiesterase n=1 Tax=Platysternon megacephalum TaxID=55544 RepID=A0A4D9DFC0_9SAUR|nr:glycerophosphodiester phosphodiesterase [Platysternon megacephalum]